MADRGFNIAKDLAWSQIKYSSIYGVKLNIPPFMRGKVQLSNSEIRRIASLRIHVEWATEKLKVFINLEELILEMLQTKCFLFVQFSSTTM